MNETIESVVIDDDDDDVEIIDVRCGSGGTESSSSKGSVSNAQTDPIKTQTGAPKKVPHSRSSLPHEINGFVKPSYNYSRLITQVLVTMPQRSATALQICDLIANKYPYFAHLNPDTNWKGSIYSALRTRKKFFTIVGMDEKNEYVWSFNPKFEQFMLDKWVPKFVRNTTLSSSTNSSLPWLPKGHPQNQLRPTLSNQSCVEPTYINTSPPSTSSNSQTPVIEYAGTLISAKPSFPSTDDCSRSSNGNETSNKDPLGPEVTLLDPTPKIQSVSSGGKLFEPWEPEVTVCEGSENDSAKPPPSSSTPQGRESLSTSTVQDKIRGHEDLSLENLHTRHVILKDEISYRVNFNKEHRSIEKFRLHCTVCDEHIGTSGVTCRLKARLHSVLGVLVCLDCYMKTYNNIANTCFWCAKLHSPVVGCHTCDKRFCQVCIERNFGQLWCANIMKKTDWRCFGCDTKQIWPHRAIAYFLFRHYRELKRRRSELMKNKHTSPSELKFYSLDLSTCCRNLEALSRAQQTNRIIAPSLKTTVATTTSTLPQKTVTPVITNNPPVAGSTAPTVTSLPSPQPLFVIGEQPPSYIYVQTPSTASSVTLNTGTQYIHNVYSSPTTSTAQLTTLPTLAVNFPGLIPVPQQVPEINLSKPPEERPPPYSLSKSPPPPYSTINVEVTTNSTSFDKGKKVLANTINKTNIPSSTKVFEIVTSASEDPIIIPDADTPEEFKVREEEVIAVPILSARERIERKPMPKSKKKSLLRTVLMNESIESMKKHLQLQNEPIISSDIKESSVKSASSKGNQNMEEPILKSIIETATERLLSLQKGQTVSSKSGYSSDKTKEVEIVTAASDASIDLATDPLANVPKIKIKTLKELQDPGVCNDDQKGQDIFSQPNEAFINENLDVKNKDVTAETSVNITNLKQGIIEASRTLINTQKKFKELAKIISSNLEYKPDKAAELITKFHDILKSCHQELNEIDSNVKEQFEYLTPTTDVDSTLQLLNKQVTDSNTEKKRKKQRKSQIHQKKRLKTTTLNNLQNSESGALESNKSEYSMNNISTGENKIRFPIKKKRDLLDFNPLGRKVILGSPEITEEDLRQIPKTWDSSSQGGWNQNNTSSSHNEVYLEELRRRQYLASKAAWKKKNIWLTSRRKKRKYTKSSLQYNTNSPLMYSEDGTLIKKRHYRKRRRFSDSDDEAVDKTYRPTNPSLYPLRQRRKVSTELSRPLRLSGRMHPSTAAHVARLSSDEDQRDFCDLIKPCSVVLERLDPKVVEILEKRITYLSDSDGSDWEGF